MIGIIIWIAGMVPCYISFRWYFNKDTGEVWTTGDRTIGMIASIFSWVGVIASIIGVLINKSLENDKPASW